MSWTYRWNIGYTDASGKWSREHGYNGTFLDGNGGEIDQDGRVVLFVCWNPEIVASPRGQAIVLSFAG